MYRSIRSVLTISAVGLLCLGPLLASTVLAGTASAAPARKGERGDPQPELKPFGISAAANSPGSVAVEPNGDLVVAYDIRYKTTGALEVCVLARGGHKCTHTSVLHTLDGDGEGGTPEVFAADGRLVVLQQTCCDSNPNDDLLFTSNNGGKSFGTPIRVGSLDVDAAALAGNDIIFSEDETSPARVQSIPVKATRPASGIATTAKETAAIGDGSYHGGALVASDDNLGPYDVTYVGYARAGTNFNASSSYHRVGAFSHEALIGISGGALVTEQDSGKSALFLRLFNGHGFGPAHEVPGTAGGGPEWFAVDQDAHGRVFVFSSRGLASRTYDLLEVSTTNGSRWTRAINLGHATRDNGFAAGLDAGGSGLVLGTDPAWGYPVLGPQYVTFSLKSAQIKKGGRTTGHGTGSPAGKGRTVWLQVQRSGLWYTVGTAHESASGSFRFRIHGGSVGRHVYRAVASDLAGYLLYGYSPARTLRVRR
jgi:hypothetical protein